ncbi:MAG: Ig-like domain-containing protein [Gemmatimonadaceae bacterium]
MIIDRIGVMRIVNASLVVAIALAGMTCADRGVVTPDLNLPTDFVVSNPMIVAATSSNTGAASLSASSQSIVYVSLPPHTFPEAATVLIETPDNDGLVTVPLIRGGFDPVAVAARAGDGLKLTVNQPDGLQFVRTLKVPARRPPTIVRSDPGKGRTDVALSVFVTVVFSEPVDATSAGQSIYLLQEGTRVKGTVQFPDNPWTAEFEPDTPLIAQSSYELVVSPNVRDLDGDVLDGSYSANFVTGTQQTSCPGYAIPSECPPFPTGGRGTISGVISERTPNGLRALGDATVFAWIQNPDGSGYARGGTQSNSDGKFTVTLLPAGMIILEGYAPGYDHPCANTVTFDGSTATENIELVAQSHPMPDAATTRPVIKGVVYETTVDGKKPIPGARVFFDPMGGMGLVAAITTTDENGRYAFCNVTPALPGWGQRIDAVKAGYVTNGQDVSAYGDTETTVDIELKR